ncbi:unnamed protein product [Zymoseptoria tritici ST99CH_3D7]|uniref:Uncharacterized protein n=2 Tax=Zymoseptoria tritici TaxID=1047171 RepID=A0A1X7S2M1_ZYMT9|nr:unnamed protein product [Zymoseptoria tritici ST99CH_3D7]SMR58356.1 unnamed protein product [Zymoseptoria tritici ST99CH_1E4]
MADNTGPDPFCNLEIVFKPAKTVITQDADTKKSIAVTKHESAEARKWKEHAAKQLAKRRAAAALKFKTLLHDLPQELFDKIHDYAMAFDIPEGCVIVVDEKYKPPSYLQITQELRDESAKEYFANNIFSFTDLRDCHKWVCALEAQHSRHVRNLRYDAHQIPDAVNSRVERPIAPMIIRQDLTSWSRAASKSGTEIDKMYGNAEQWLNALHTNESVSLEWSGWVLLEPDYSTWNYGCRCNGECSR